MTAVRTSTGVGRPVMAMAGGGGVGDHADPVFVAASGHPDVEVLAGGGGVGEEHGPVDGDAFGLVDGHGVGQGDVRRRRSRRGGRPGPGRRGGRRPGRRRARRASTCQRSPLRTQSAGGGDQAAVVAGGDDLVAPADDLARRRRARRVRPRRRRPVRPGPAGPGRRPWRGRGRPRRSDSPAARAACQAGEGVVDHLLPVLPTGDPAPGVVLVEDRVVSVAEPEAWPALPRGRTKRRTSVSSAAPLSATSEAEQPAGLHGAELAVVPDQHQLGVGRLRPPRPGAARSAVATMAGFVDHDHLAGTQVRPDGSPLRRLS